jgi:hypothetical protein
MAANSCSSVVVSRRDTQILDQLVEHVAGAHRVERDQALQIGQRIEQHVRLDLCLQQAQLRLQCLALDDLRAQVRLGLLFLGAPHAFAVPDQHDHQRRAQEREDDHADAVHGRVFRQRRRTNTEQQPGRVQAGEVGNWRGQYRQRTEHRPFAQAPDRPLDEQQAPAIHDREGHDADQDRHQHVFEKASRDQADETRQQHADADRQRQVGQHAAQARTSLLVNRRGEAGHVDSLQKITVIRTGTIHCAEPARQRQEAVRRTGEWPE